MSSWQAVDPDEMLHNAAFSLGLHCVIIQKGLSENEYNCIWKL